MRHPRFKLVGLWVVIAAASTLAADDGRPPQSSQKAAESGEPPAKAEPARQPTEMKEIRFSPAAGNSRGIDPLWFSQGKSGGIPSSSAGTITAGAYADTSKVIAASQSSEVAPRVIECSCATLGAQDQFRQSSGVYRWQPLPARALLPWLKSFRQVKTWPPAGPLVGIVAQIPITNNADLPPVSQPPAIPAWAKDVSPQVPQPAPPVQPPPAIPPAANILPLPLPLQNQSIPQPMPVPAQPPAVVTPQPPMTNSATATSPAIPPAPQTQVLPMPKTEGTPVVSTPAPQNPPSTLVPQNPPLQPVVQQPVPQPAPSPAIAPTPMPPSLAQPPAPAPSAPQTATQPTPANILPPPRTLGSDSPVAPVAPASPLLGSPEPCELPTAPPELMHPEGVPVPGKAGVFGSDPVRISRDYPCITDVCGTSIKERLESLFTPGQDGYQRGYISAENLIWWMRGLTVPVLATSTTDPAGHGFIGQPGTFPVIGSGTFLGSARDGLRLRAGLWLDDHDTWGIDGSIFFLGQRDADAAYGSSQYPTLTRPVYSPNTIPGTGIVIGETGEAVSVPGVLSGALTVHAQSSLWGGDVNLSRSLCVDCDSRASVFVGYRNLDLAESVTINENITVIGSGGSHVIVTDPIGTLVAVQDKFATQNYFNGGQIGGLYERRWGRFDLEARASIAFGATQEELNISGYQAVTLPGAATQTFRGGLLAVGPNLGDFTRDKFSVVPELTLNAGYWVMPNLKVHVGYNFIYWTNVIRPGEQIDRVVNLSYVPNAPAVGASSLIRPEALFQQSNMLVHGLQFGIEWRW